MKYFIAISFMFVFFVSFDNVKAEICATSDAFKLGEVEEKDLDEVYKIVC